MHICMCIYVYLHVGLSASYCLCICHFVSLEYILSWFTALDLIILSIGYVVCVPWLSCDSYSFSLALEFTPYSDFTVLVFGLDGVLVSQDIRTSLALAWSSPQTLLDPQSDWMLVLLRSVVLILKPLQILIRCVVAQGVLLLLIY